LSKQKKRLAELEKEKAEREEEMDAKQDY